VTGFALQQLRDDHREAVLAFELENRAYFARSISDRGDDFFERYDAQHETLLTQQAAGGCAFYVLVDESDSAVVGRFNLYDLQDGMATVGYRLAEAVAGRGAATQALLELCQLATERHGVRTLTAETSLANRASQRVLEKAGFTPVGECVVAGKPGLRFRLGGSASRAQAASHSSDQ
jgi:ribosomal-protein-alanine N-acetyltransferase